MEIFTNVKSLLVASGVFRSVKNFDNDKLAKLLRTLKVLTFLTIFFGFYLLTFIYSVKYLHIMEAMQAAGYINNGVLCVGIGYASLIYNRNDLLNTISSWEQAIIGSKLKTTPSVYNLKSKLSLVFLGIQAKPSSEQFYLHGTENVSKIFKRVSIFYLCLTVSIFTTTVVVVPIVHLLYGNLDPTTWVQVYDAFM